MKRLTILLTMIIAAWCNASAQEWMRMHRHDGEVRRTVPLEMKRYSQYDFSDGGAWLNAYAVKEDGSEMMVPFAVAGIDSIDFAYDLTDEEKGHDKHRVFCMHVTTEDAAVLMKEEWVNCHIAIDGMGEYSDYSGTARLRGRGNSSWEWYDKKPFKFKLDSKSKLLGLEKAKNWNMLANYRDPTDMMNVFAFEAARQMGMPNTNHSRFVEVYLNGEYVGVYQLTEKIEIGANRVNIDPAEGVLMCFDEDDGPNLSPAATDNFWSKVYKLPMCVKEPEDLTTEQMDAIIDDFAKLETAIKSRNFKEVEELMDVASFVGILQMHELLFNVEIDAPRSLYIYKDKDGKYTFGPVWDWDAGYDFDWADMTHSHLFFSSIYELIYGKDPVKGTDAAYSINMFWRDLFGNADFVKQYKEAWKAFDDEKLAAAWDETQKFVDALTESGAYDRDYDKWPLVSNTYNWWGGIASSQKLNATDEVAKMHTWLTQRKAYLDGVIAGYPNGNNEIDDIPEGDLTVVATIEKKQDVAFSKGYSQSGSISVQESEVVSQLGGTPSALVPLNADGTEGSNTAAGTYGAWFDDNGTAPWASAHVFIESNNLYSWSFGCHPDNCWYGDKHTVTMQYQRGKKAVNVKVTMNVK